MKLKHSKFKNTGLIFEILVKKITSEALSNANESKAYKILEQHFNKKNVELHQEFLLTKSLVETTYKEEKKAEMLLETVLSNRNKINKAKLDKQKYNLVKQIKETYNIDEFFATKVDNYPTLANIYKLFEFNTISTNPTELIDTKFALMEHTLDAKTKKTKVDDLAELKLIFEQQDKDIQLLSQKIMVDKFNTKYDSDLNKEQKSILRNYITEDLDALNENVSSAIKYVTKLVKECRDDVFKIKLEEINTLLNESKNMKKIDDKKVTALLQIYELTK